MPADSPAFTRSEATRRRLRDAAVRAFAQRGFHATTTRDISAAAGMSPAAMYVHHRSKEELLHLIAREGHLAALDTVRAARRADRRPADQLVAVMSAFVRFHAEHQVEARVLTYELGALAEEHLEEILALRREIDTELRDLVRAGMEAGAFRTTDASLAATALGSMAIDIARWYREDGAWTVDQIAEHYATAALRMLGADRSS